MWGLGVLIPLLGAGALRVLQSPGEARVTAGDTVALGCRVEVAEGRYQLRMEWVRAGGRGALCTTRLGTLGPAPPDPCAPPLRLAWQPPRATLSLPRVWDNDSGHYLCRVTLEIPRYATATGAGTVITVTNGTDGTDGTDGTGTGHDSTAGVLGGVLGGLGGTALLGTALLGYCCCHRSSGTPIYQNVVPPPARDPKKLPPPPGAVPTDNPYQGGPRWARGPPAAPRP